MSNPLLIIGESGTGKTACLRNMESNSTFLIQVISKPLPFPGWRKKFHLENEIGPANLFVCDIYNQIIQAMKKISKDRPEVTTIVVDDFQYLMANEYMKRANEKGYEKFTQIAANAWNVINTCNSLRDDINVVFLSHSEESDTGKTKCKTIGKMLDQTITIEGMFTMVLQTVVKDGQYCFLTRNNGNNTVKSPMGLFNEVLIENDLKTVLDCLEEYEKGEEPAKTPPSRASTNGELSEIETIEEFTEYAKKYQLDYGVDIWEKLSGKRGDKTETNKMLFDMRKNKIMGVPPVDASGKELQETFDQMCNECTTADDIRAISVLLSSNPSLQCKENKDILFGIECGELGD